MHSSSFASAYLCLLNTISVWLVSWEGLPLRKHHKTKVRLWTCQGSNSANRWMVLDPDLRGPAATLFTSRDSCSDSIAKLFGAWRGRIAQLSGGYVAKWGTVDKELILDERQITHLICARIKYDLYDLFRGCFGAFYTRKKAGSRPITALEESYRSYFRRAQIRWVIWRSSI